MKKEELLKAMGKLDDELIEAAAVSESFEKTKRFGLRNYVKAAVCVAAVLALFIGVSVPRMGAGKSAGMEYAVTDEEAPAQMYDFAEAEIAAGSMNLKTKEAGMSVSGVFEEYIPQKTQKLVYRANLSVETESYDDSYEKLSKLVSDLGGYFESSSSYNGSYYSTNVNKNGYFTIRIPIDKYSAFMNSMSSDWHVSDRSESIEDISDSYYDTEDRLKTLQIKEERLNELLKSATNLSDIIELEYNLTDTESQIANLTRTIKGYDDMVDYATIDISLYQVSQMGSTVGSEGFGKRFIRSLKNGFKNFSEDFADILVWLGYNIIQIVIVLAVLILIWRFKLIRKLFMWIRK